MTSRARFRPVNLVTGVILASVGLAAVLDALTDASFGSVVALTLVIGGLASLATIGWFWIRPSER